MRLPLRTLKIGHRLVLCLTLIVLLMLGAVAMSMFGSQNSREMLHRRVASSSDRLAAIKSMRQLVEREDRLAHKLGLANGIEEADAGMKAIELALERNRAILAQLGRSSDSPADRALVEAIQGYDHSLAEPYAAARRSVDGFNPGMAARMLGREVDPVHTEWLATLDRLADLQTERIVLEIESMDKVADSIDRQIEAIAGLAFLVAAVVGWRLTTGITRPLKRAVEFAAAVGSGHLSAPLPTASADECGMLLLALKDMATRLQAAQEEMNRLAIVDGLTGAYNRRHFDAVLRKEFCGPAQPPREVADRVRADDGECLSLLLIDVDHFKDYNDRFGHPAGDACLRAIVESVLKVGLRPDDVVARYGGEEFVVVLPRCAPAAAYAVAERVRRAVEKLHLGPDTPLHVPVSVSIGIATRDGADCCSVEKLIGAADAAMYEAKHCGRNTVRPLPADLPEAPEGGALADAAAMPEGGGVALGQDGAPCSATPQAA